MVHQLLGQKQDQFLHGAQLLWSPTGRRGGQDAGAVWLTSVSVGLLGLVALRAARGIACSMRCRTVSDGCAPFARQAASFSASIRTNAGERVGSYRPI